MIAWWKNLSVTKKLYSVVGLMAILIASELFTLIFAMTTLSSVRAFVMGEGLWSKSQKDAIHSLYQYALTGKEKYFKQFQNYLKIPEGDHKGRIELAKNHFDIRIVRKGFEEGGNDPQDIDGMVELLVRFHGISYIRDAILAWRDADKTLDQLRAAADELHGAISGEKQTPRTIDEILDQIASINNQLTKLEVRFSSSLGAGSRWLEHILMIVLALTVFTVECTGITLTYRFSRNLGRSLNELTDVAAEVERGNFSVQAPVRSRDELGQLAESLNRMILSLNANVSERNRAQEQLKVLNEDLERRVDARTRELKNRESQLRLITNALPEVVAQLDRRERIQFANEAFCSRFGQPLEELLGKTFSEIVGESRYLANKNYFETCYGGEVASFERTVDADGTPMVYKVTLIPEKNDSGETVGIVLVAVDVTTYKRIERELKRAKDAADAANATKSAFLANMSHEIRTPLGAILGYSELMMDQNMTVSDRLNSVEVIKRNGKLLSTIINDILDLSKIEAGRLEVEKAEISLEEVVIEIESLLNLEASGKGIQLIIKSEGPVPDSVLTDPLRLRQILLNIVGNAIKFTSKGSVEMKIKLVPGHDGSTKLAFLVTDTGEGIDPTHASRLFQPFSQADVSTTRKFGGTGLGLVLSRRLAQALGGDVALVESRRGHGSTFLITIDPGTGEKVFFHSLNPAKSLFPGYDQHVRLNSLRVLVVDDSLDNLILVSNILRFAGANVETAATGREAVDKTLNGDFGLVLMDLQMPVMDGYEATQELRARGYKGPIIALTAHAMKGERLRCLENGFNDHIPKPIDRVALLSTVSHYAAM
jgi:PAS domain S-box-containing protein